MGIYSDRSERVFPDQSGLVPVFSSSDPGVATVDADGQVTAIAPGGIDIFAEYAGLRTAATVIVYAPFVEIPPYDPQLVVQPDLGSPFVVNRVLVKPTGDAYDGALARAIAADHGASLLAEWKNLVAFLLEYDIDTIDQLYDALVALDTDDRVVAYQLDYLHSPAQTAGEPGTLPRFANVFGAWAELERLGRERLTPVHIAVVDFDLSFRHADPERRKVISSEIIGPQSTSGYTFDVTGTVVVQTSSDEFEGFSHGLAVSSIIAGQDKVRGVVSKAPGVPYTLHLYSMNDAHLGAEDAELKNILDHLSHHMDKVDVVNMSFGSACNDSGISDRLLDILGEELGEALKEALKEELGEEVGELLGGAIGGAMDRMSAGTYLEALLEQIPRRTLEAALGPAWATIIEAAMHELDKKVCDVITDWVRGREFRSHFADMSKTVFVAAAGNSSADVRSRYEYYPAVLSLKYGNVITVGAINSVAWSPLRRDSAADRACFSNYGEAVTVAAEGYRVYALDLRDRESDDKRPPGVWYSELPGTSFSAPIVTSVVALLRAVDPSLTPQEIRELLIQTGDVVAVDQVPRENCGDAPPGEWKRVNAGRAIEAARLRTDHEVAATVPPTPTPPPPIPVPSVSAGWEHTCEVKADGSVACWGSNGEGQASPPDGEFVSVSAGWAHSCGIRTDRSVVCWGRNEEGQSSAPRGAFISVSAGRVHSCGVRLNGLVECWGEDQPFGRLTIPPNLFNSFSSVSATNYHSCGIRGIGTVACWGFGEGGRTMPPPDLFTSVSVGGNHSCGIRTDGSVACWGHNEEGQATPPPGTFVSVSVSKEGLRTCGVRTDGSATCWGAGILVSIVLTDISMPVPIQPDGPFSSISAGYQHVCGLKADGDVACWGTNGRGQAMPPGVSLESVSPG